MKRQGIFLLYDEQGCVDEYVIYMLQSMSSYFEKITVVCNGVLKSEGRRRLEVIGNVQVFVRENKGFDVWAYRDAIEYIGWETIRNIDELIMFNYTLMGPVYEGHLNEMFKKMDGETVDFWGLTLYHGVSFDPWGILPEHRIPDHLQSHFIAVRKHMLSSIEFRKYWESRPMINYYEEAVAFHEAIFTQYFENRGFTWMAYCNPEKEMLNNPYPLFVFPIQMIEQLHCPFFKRKLFFYPMKEKIIDSSSYISRKFYHYIKNETPYNENLILENLIRTVPMQDVVDGLGLNVILDSAKTKDIEKTAVIIDEDFYLHHTLDLEKINGNVDIYYWGSAESYSQIQNKNYIQLLSFQPENFASVYYSIFDLEKEYEYICFLVNESKQNIEDDLDNGNVAWITENSMLGNDLSAEAVVSYFRDNPKAGFLYSPNPVQSLFYSRQYVEQEEVCEEVKDFLRNRKVYTKINDAKIKGSIGQYASGCFWSRSNVLKNILSNIDRKDWFSISKMPVSVFTVVVNLYAQTLGFYSANLSNQQLAGVQLDINRVMNQQLNSTLKNRTMNFSQVCKKIECLKSDLECEVYYDFGLGFSPVYKKTLKIDCSENGSGKIQIPILNQVNNVRLLFPKNMYIMFEGIRCVTEKVELNINYKYRDDRYTILYSEEPFIDVFSGLDEIEYIDILFDNLAYGYMGCGMGTIIDNIQYKEDQLSDMRLSLQDYQNDLINKRAVISLQKRRLKEITEENKRLKTEQKQLYEMNGYLTNERNALLEYRNEVENSKTKKMLQKIDKMRGKR